MDGIQRGWGGAQGSAVDKAVATFLQNEGLEERVWRILKLLKLIHLATREVGSPQLLEMYP
jgi:hypothetical protein